MSVCAVFGYLLSFPAGLVFHSEAMTFHYSSEPSKHIVTEQLHALSRMQTGLIVAGAFVGFFSAQSVFLVKHLRTQNVS